LLSGFSFDRREEGGLKKKGILQKKKIGGTTKKHTNSPESGSED